MECIMDALIMELPFNGLLLAYDYEHVLDI
jgi:hypothetical protein